MSHTRNPELLSPELSPEPTPHLPDPAPGEDELDVCRKLRTKLAFTPLVDSAGEQLLWQRGDGSTAVYWCLSTMECAGPDGGLAHATVCKSGRGCYRMRG